MSTILPSRHGYTTRDGVRVHWEEFGVGERNVFLLPTWSIVHSRHWKFQIAWLARRCRVLVMDGRGNGLSDRPSNPAEYADEEFAADALAVMDDVGIETAAVVSFSAGAAWALMVTAQSPHRVASLAFIAPGLPLGTVDPIRQVARDHFEDSLDEYEGWMKSNANYWVADYRGYLEIFFARCFPEAHSTKQIEDAVGWGLETNPEVLIATMRAAGIDRAQTIELAKRVACPVLVIHGDADEIVRHEVAADLADLTNGQLLTMEGSGHLPHTRDPVAVNLALDRFLLPPRHNGVRRRAPHRERRALFVSSPIGLGHARRDVAIADELRRIVPDLKISWLAQDPVTRVLERRGEDVHPASKLLVSESEHIERQSASHRLHIFEAWRRMDEIFLANFMVFLDAAREGEYDLWIGDEAWELDHFLHENPELKQATYVWLTDIVAWLPMPGLGEREAFLTADYNAEMIEHIERFPRVRDCAIFIGRPEDVVPGTFGPALPEVRAWTEERYRFTGGYIVGPDGDEVVDRRELRREFGYEPEEVICIASVGGSGVGSELLKRLMESFPGARARVPNLRMIAVAGPRVDVSSLPNVEGVEVQGFVPDLNRRLAACDVALTQGGLSTTMELTAARVPFLYFPLRDHCEQNFHVRHRLDRYRAGNYMNYDDASAETISAAIASLVSEPVDYVEVEKGAAGRAASLIAELM